MKKKMHESAPQENVGTLPEHAAGLEGHEKRTQDALLALSNTQKKLAETSEKREYASIFVTGNTYI